MKLRKHYTKEDKMRALFQLSLGNTSLDALICVGFDVENSPVKDKKYAPKLINKWRKEIFLNKNLIKNINKEFNSTVFEKEACLPQHDFIVNDYVAKFKRQKREKMGNKSFN